MGSAAGCDDPGALHVVLFPFMSKGHTIPILHLARLLLSRNIAVTIFTTPANRPFIVNTLHDTTASVVELPFISSGVESTDNLPSMSLFPQFALATEHMQQDFERVLEKLLPVNFMVSDGFLWWTLESASKFTIPRLVFYGFSYYSLTLAKIVAEDRLLFGPESDDELITVTRFPWIKVTKNDFEQFSRDPQPKGLHVEFVYKSIIASSASYGYIMNSFYELESVFVDYCNNDDKNPKSWCVGPFCLAEPQKPTDEHELQNKCFWIQWLDQKLAQGSSVLYVAFGTQAEISAEQLKEIAIGLEESKVNFMWVIRKKESGLGDGFEERVKERGIIVRDWVDQREILAHQSVQGFLSHCGWNSVLESICAGVPILAWPMMAEQPMNARMVAEEIKVGLRVDGSGRVGFVKWEVLEKAVRELIEGEKGKEVRRNAKEFGEKAKKAMEEGNGSSWLTLNLVIDELCNNEKKERK